MSKNIDHNWIHKSQENPTSLQLAINAACTACLGGSAEELPDPGWKQSIRNCTGLCPLISVRPYKKDKAGDDEDDLLELDDLSEVDDLSDGNDS